MAYSYGSKLLIDESPLMIQPSLAKIFGINHAIFLQQLQYWLTYSNHIHNDRKWVYNTYKGWQEKLQIFSVSTIRRIIDDLKEKGIIITSNFNTKAMDRTIWYTIDYDVMQEYVKQKTLSLRKDNTAEKYIDPENGEEISSDSVPDELKLPITQNPYEPPKSPDVNDEQSDLFNMSNPSVQIEQMQKPQYSSPFVQNDTPYAQPEQMKISRLDTPCAQPEHTDLSKLSTAIPLDNTLDYKHKNTTTEESPPKSYPQESMNEDDVVVVLKNNFLGEYKLCQEAHVDPKVLFYVLNRYPKPLVTEYLKWTVNEYKNGKLVNPTGWFLAALKQGYKYYAVPETEGPDPNMAEIIRRTEEDIKKSSDEYRDLLLPSDSPFAKYIV